MYISVSTSYSSISVNQSTPQRYILSLGTRVSLTLAGSGVRMTNFSIPSLQMSLYNTRVVYSESSLLSSNNLRRRHCGPEDDGEFLVWPLQLASLSRTSNWEF